MTTLPAQLLADAEQLDAMAQRQRDRKAPAMSRATHELARQYRDLADMLVRIEEQRRREAEGASNG